jgi:homoserine dehydrogenase
MPVWPQNSRLRVALLGFGTVGQAVASILCDRAAPDLELAIIFNRRIADKRTDWIPRSVKWTDSIEEALTSDVDVVVELLGGLNPAYEWVARALTARKSVVTANKQLIAYHGTELRRLARAHGMQLRFEASVAGGVPVLRAIEDGLAGDRLIEIRGILNGTCAYILSRMQTDDLSFAEGLAEAQAAGYAEVDPADDVDGADAAAKLAILAAVGLRAPVHVGDIATRTIRPVDSVDFQYARELGCTIRQIARASLQDDRRVFAVVGPALVPLSSAFGQVAGNGNLVTVRGMFGGQTSFSGSGAGGAPTAVAVVSDLLSISRQMPDGHGSASPEETVHDVATAFVAPHYVRFTVADRPGILAEIFAVFGEAAINVDAVLQLPRFRKDRLAFAATLEPSSSTALERAIATIAGLDFHVAPPLTLPILR